MNYDQAIQVLQNEIDCVNRDGCDRECCARCDLAMEKADVLAALNLAIECVQTITSQDLVKVVHAHWVRPAHDYEHPYCSHCKNPAIRYPFMGHYMPDYCPKCGAKMDEATEDNPTD